MFVQQNGCAIRCDYTRICKDCIKISMNVLGVIFAAKLNWSELVPTSVMKAKRSLNTINLIGKYFLTIELLKLITNTNNLYYNSEIWNSSSLSYHFQQPLMSSSGYSLRVCLHYQAPQICNPTFQNL
jgi:hypothetical protein